MKTWMLLWGLALSGAAGAGEIYGAITRDGRAVANEPVTVACTKPAKGPVLPVFTDGFGAYRLQISGEGSCTISVRGASGTRIRSTAQAQRFNFQIRSFAGTPRLERQ